MTTDHTQWRRLWLDAISNMPTRRSEKLKQWGQYGALARCLKLPLNSPSGFSAHNRIYTNLIRGSRPKCHKAQYGLQVLAGPLGKAIAKYLLTEQGLAQRYKWD